MQVIIIHRCYNDIEADQIRELLLSEEIECQVVSDVPHSVFPLTLNGLGEIRIGVLESEADRARKLIEAFLDAPESPFTEASVQE